MKKTGCLLSEWKIDNTARPCVPDNQDLPELNDLFWNQAEAFPSKANTVENESFEYEEIRQELVFKIGRLQM